MEHNFMTPLTGQTIHGYEIRDMIGKGGYGVVYRAYQAEIKRDVAIKVILPELANEDEFIKRFQTEAQLIAQLEHPHIIPLYDYWQDDHGAFLVMRYVASGTLEELLLQDEALSWAQINRIFMQVCEALEVAHDKGVIHRDIKPANILLDDRGNAYLTDFGLAWMVGSKAQAHGVSGTIAYMAPEIVANSDPSPQSDLYALGILLYHMLSGTHPFKGTISEVLDGHLNLPMPSILDTRTDLSAGVDLVIDRLTMKDPADRYTSVKELLSALSDIALPKPDAPKATISIASMGSGLHQLAQKRGNTLGLRNRFSMIHMVYSYWIEGVLENLLSGNALLDLDLQLEPHYVYDPKNEVNEVKDEQAKTIAQSANSILNIFEAYNGKLLMLGDAGAGKSTLMLALARDLLQQASEDEDFPIPVIFNLASWDGKLSMSDWLEQELHKKYQVPRSVAKRWVKEDLLLLLLDGLDEVLEEHRQHCLDAINTWCDDHAFGDVVVSSRLVDYLALSDQLHLNGCAVVQLLSDEQVTNYLDTIGNQTSGLQTVLKRNPEMRELSRSPLMLSVMLTAYQNVSTEEVPSFESLDEQRHYFFGLYVKRAWERRKVDKHFSLEEINKWSSRLASYMSTSSQTMFFVEDLQPSWLAPDNKKRFHLIYAILISLIFSASWFASSLLFISPDEHLYYAAMGAVWGWVLFVGNQRIGIVPSLILFIVLTSIFRITLDSDESVIGFFQKSLFRSVLPYTFIIGVLMGLYRRTGQSIHRIHSVDSLHFSFTRGQWIGGLAGLISGVFVTIPNIFIDQDVSLIEALFKILGPGLIAWFFTGFRSNQVQESAEINEKIHRSLRNGIQMGLVGGIGAMLMIALAFYPEGFDLAEEAPALFNFLPMAMSAMFVYGGAIVLQHYLLRRSLVRDNIIPQQLVALLQEGVQLGIMRRVGGGFIFIHRYILEYFAKQETQNSA